MIVSVVGRCCWPERTSCVAPPGGQMVIGQSGSWRRALLRAVWQGIDHYSIPTGPFASLLTLARSGLCCRLAAAAQPA